MRNRTINALLKIGMPAGIKGFEYIVYAMDLLDREDIRLAKTTFLYHLIAKKYNDTIPKVEGAIRHAFGFALEKGNAEAVEKYLTLQSPTNSNLLHVLYLRLTQEE